MADLVLIVSFIAIEHFFVENITFSKSEINDSCVDKVLRAGGNVAVVFEKVLPGYYKGVPVINGDESDVRFMDSKGVIVGLKAKGLGKVDSSGFVVREMEIAQ